jgi:hypothetical protein
MARADLRCDASRGRARRPVHTVCTPSPRNSAVLHIDIIMVHAFLLFFFIKKKYR